MGQAEEEGQNKTGRIGKAERDRPNLTELERQNLTGRTGQA
jgi:hypothetical protein